MSFIGALDQGTSSTRFMIFNEEGAVLGQHQLEHKHLRVAKKIWNIR